MSDEEIDFLDKAAIAALTGVVTADYNLSYDKAAAMAYRYALALLDARRTGTLP